MIIFHNAVFIHVPKTAGTSFETMCEERHRIKYSGDQHNTAIDIPDRFRDQWIFGFIRDPMIAEYSNYRYHKFAWVGNDKFDFESWCEWRFTDKPEEYGYELGLNEEQVEYGYRFNVLPQMGYFCDAEGNCIADTIYRYEQITEALPDISAKLGLNCSIEGFQGMEYNWSRGREKYSENITDRTVEIMRRAKGVDFMIHSLPGPVRTDFHCKTKPNYAYSR